MLIALGVVQATSRAATITVTGTGDTIAVDGLVTLREAITSANNNANVNADVVAVGAYGTDTINFAIAGAGVHTISPTSALPTVTDTVVINGYSQPGSSANTLAVGDNAVLRIEINGTNAAGAAFIVNSAGNTFKGLVINRFFNASFNAGYAFRLMGAGNTIQGCYLGTNPAGDTDLHDTGGVSVEAGGNNLIGGPSAAARNLVLGSSGNNAIEITGGNGNAIQGNYIGTNAAGSAILGVPGIDILTSNNTIGGTVAGARNVTFSNGGLASTFVKVPRAGTRFRATSSASKPRAMQRWGVTQVALASFAPPTISLVAQWPERGMSFPEIAALGLAPLRRMVWLFRAISSALMLPAPRQSLIVAA